jgi:hypothetical protein
MPALIFCRLRTGILSDMSWAGGRFWPVCPAMHLVQTARTILRQACFIETHLATPTLGYHLDHQIDGTVLVPAATLLEVVSASGHVLRAGESRGVAFVNGAIPMPAIMSKQQPTIVLQCEISMESARILLRSIKGRNGPAVVHLMAGVSNSRALGQRQTKNSNALTASTSGFIRPGHSREWPIAISSTGAVTGGEHQGCGVHPAMLDNNLHVRLYQLLAFHVRDEKCFPPRI